MIEELEEYKHCYKVKVRFSDFDMMKHVNNTRHLVFVEDARVNYLEEVTKRKLYEVAVNAIVARVEIDYIKPIELGYGVEVYTKCERIGNKSFTLSSITVCYPDKSPSKKQIAAKAKTVIVSFDYNTNKTIQNPLELVEALNSFENCCCKSNKELQLLTN